MRPVLLLGILEVSRPPLHSVTDRTRRIVRERDKVCVYCGRPDGPFHFDHRQPRSAGGSNGPENIVLACVDCNLSKAARSVEEWRLYG